MEPDMDIDSLANDMTRNYGYTGSLPGPPHLDVPPPQFDRDRTRYQDGINEVFEPVMTFLPRIIYDSNDMSESIARWRYEQRREAQQILPCLYLGPLSSARDKATLSRLGITMVIVVRKRSTLPCRTAASELDITTVTETASNPQELLGIFPTIIGTINDHVSYLNAVSPNDPPQKVLMLCETGNDYGAAAVAAYILAMYSTMDLVRCLQLLQGHRFSISWDDPVKQMLGTWVDITIAQQQVAATATNDGNKTIMAGTERGGSARKRSVTQPGTEDEVDMELADDVERFSLRYNVPFR